MGLLSNLAIIGRRVDRLRDTMHKLDSTLANQCEKHLDDYERRVLRDAKDTLDDPNENEVSIGLNQGKIASIKAYRERTGKGLAESKDAMEKHFDKLGYQFYTYTYEPASNRY